VDIPRAGQNMKKNQTKPDSIPRMLAKIQYPYSILKFKPYS